MRVYSDQRPRRPFAKNKEETLLEIIASKYGPDSFEYHDECQRIEIERKKAASEADGEASREVL